MIDERDSPTAAESTISLVRLAASNFSPMALEMVLDARLFEDAGSGLSTRCPNCCPERLMGKSQATYASEVCETTMPRRGGGNLSSLMFDRTQIPVQPCKHLADHINTRRHVSRLFEYDVSLVFRRRAE